MRTIFLKFASETEATASLYGEDGTPICPNIDIIGDIENCDGWHVNLAADICPESLTTFELFPANPRRIYGGID